MVNSKELYDDVNKIRRALTELELSHREEDQVNFQSELELLGSLVTTFKRKYSA